MRVNPSYPCSGDKLVYGIQGGEGSFNQQALLRYLEDNHVTNFVVEYLYTTEKVLQELNIGRIDRGQFAIHNSLGGIVDESIEAMGRYRFEVMSKYSIMINQTLLMRKDADFSDIDTIMTHPQVLAQCKRNLAEQYPYLLQTSGSGALIDHSLVAKFLAEGRLAKNIAIIGSSVLATVYGLTIVQERIQDINENTTTFLQVRLGC